ncbi:MAG TPA: class II aldolase/adducin family protein [Candidatus Acidoferrum sp.]|nr:class II aldolase/adducin family protein [Candidatus Acidoferrum sp.]
MAIVAGVDFGTLNVRVSVVDSDRGLLATALAEYPLHAPRVLMAGHMPFCWGATSAEAAHDAVIVEEIAALALQTFTANHKARPIDKALHEKHFFRKRGNTAYYGQKPAH